MPPLSSRAREVLALLGAAGAAGNEEVVVVGPGLLGVADGRIRRVVGMAVVVADDVETGAVAVLFDRAVLARIDLVGVARSLGVGVRRASDLRDRAGAFGGHEHSTDLVGIALGHVRADPLESRRADLHFRP